MYLCLYHLRLKCMKSLATPRLNQLRMTSSGRLFAFDSHLAFPRKRESEVNVQLRYFRHARAARACQRNEPSEDKCKRNLTTRVRSTEEYTRSI